MKYPKIWTRSSSGPIEITGETTRSWIYGPPYCPTKINKKRPNDNSTHPRYFFTEAERDLAAWADKYRYKIGDAVQFYQLPPEILKKVAELIGFEEE